MVTRDKFEHLISHKDFEQVMKGMDNIPDSEISKLREGDLISRIITGSVSPSYHAGVYCGNEEIISFTAPSGTKWYERIQKHFVPQQSASVIKESVTNFLNGKSYKVFRLKSPVPGDFSNSVKTAMKYNEEYNLLKNNCLHFARRLLKLPPEPFKERNSPSDSGSQIQNDKANKSPVKNGEGDQSLSNPKTSESTTNEGDQTTDVNQ